MSETPNISLPEFVLKETAARWEQLTAERAESPVVEPVAWLTDRQEMFFDKEDAMRSSDGFIEPLYRGRVGP